ncbi:helix-turn-helix domain-containing protein [Deminuibacter soli]|uniref:AraC family transcriptional regulator n=1 Tax=Deminuibacter soli TaxID=2291815 RepID=A0A3E1NK83_9BACT|nr:helix-turn-helix domain-containing protein [Deminuibacter soli]RFM28234.1 AraC family transcriptional regulator [Deminuibacter soli]
MQQSQRPPFSTAAQNEQHTFIIQRLNPLINTDAVMNAMPATCTVALLWLTSGQGVYNDGGTPFNLQAGQLLCIRRKQVQQLQLSSEASGYSLFFAESFLYNNEQEFDLMDHAGLSCLFAETSGITISDDLCPEMMITAENMLREHTNNYMFKSAMLRRYLKIFLMQVTRNLQGNVLLGMETRNSELTKQFLSLVDVHFKNKKLVVDYADELLVTANHLNQIVKKTTGYTASYHIRQRVILEAKRHAASSGSCMKEIAWLLGFSDTSHFSKYFKGITGISFSDFKKERMTITAQA